MTRHLFALLLGASLLLPEAAGAKDDTRWLRDSSQAARIERVERRLGLCG
jgi:hypothetical protein